jgi:hypothetical protein
MSETATIETLTAEVKALVIGNRQVTLSVARQLDSFDLVVGAFCGDFDPDKFTPFGRIKTGRKGPRYARCGRSEKDAEWNPIRHACSGFCNHDKLRGSCGIYERLTRCEYDFEWIGRLEPSGQLTSVCAFCEWPERVNEDPDLAPYAQWFTMPLIVLAGLR